MRKRKLALALASLLLMPSATTYALGLGEIETLSGLNQPLIAEIQLLSIAPEEMADVTVKFADSAAYEAAGIDKSPLLADMQFAVLQKPDGTSVIQVKSSQPIREPFLDFIIEVNWPAGRLLREYAMLLDPPVFVSDSLVDNLPPPIAQAQGTPTAPSDAAPTQPTHPAANESNQATEPQPVSAPPTDAGGAMHGPISRNETLWDIAKRLRPNESVSIERMMMALFRANPNAFFGKNVNNLKSGVVLRVPDPDAINAMDQSTAINEARRHYQRWIEGKKSSPLAGNTDQQGTAVRTDSVEGKSDSAAPKGQLKLIAPEGEGAVRGGNGKGTAAKDVQTLNQELQLAIETGDAARQENDELKARVAALEEQLNTMQRLITLKDDALVEMQTKQGNAATVAPPAPVPAPTPAVTKPAEPVVPPPAAVAPASESIWSMLTSPLVLGILVIVGLLVGALGWLFARRRQQQRQEDYDEEETFQPLKRNFNFSAQETTSMPIVEQTFAEPEHVFHATSNVDDSLSDDSEIDPLAEADVYLAYRRYQQAQDLIKDALEHEPGRQDLQVKLLEIYFAMGNKEAFEAQVESFYTTLTSDDHEVWEKIVDMGREISLDHPLFNDQAQMHAQHSNVPANDGLGEDVRFEVGSAKDTSNLMEFENSYPSVPDHEAAPVFSQFTDAKSASNSLGGLDFNLDDDVIQQIRAAADTRKGPQGLSDDLEGLVVDKLFDSGELVEDLSEQQSQRQVSRDAELEAMLAQVEEVGFEKVFGFDDAHFSGGEEDLFASNDMVGTKLDLARAYIDMDDGDGARSILGEVLQEGSDTQKEEARELIRRIS